MRFFVYKILFFSISLIILSLVADLFVFPENNNVMGFKNHSIQDREPNLEILIMGNSHTYFGLNPSFINYSTFNLANKSRKLETDLFLLKKILDQLDKLKVVIVPISYYTLFTEKIGTQEKRLYYNFFKLNEYNQGFFNNSLLLNEPFNELIDDFFIENIKVSNDGWRANANNYKFDALITKEKIGNIKERLGRNNIIKKNLGYLQEIVNLCDVNRIKLLLLLPPYHPDFYKYSNEKYEVKIKNLLGKVNLKTTTIFDGREFRINDDIYYENIDHLNIKGAEVLSIKLDSILKKMLDE